MDWTKDFYDEMYQDLLVNTDISTIANDKRVKNANDKRDFGDKSKLFALMGRVAALNDGSKFGVQGDKLPSGPDFFKPVGDDDMLHDVFQLKPFEAADGDWLVKLWKDQCECLRKIENSDQFQPRNLTQIPVDVISSVKSSDGNLPCFDFSHARLNVLWNKYEIPPDDAVIVKRQDRRKVTNAAFYEPDVMPLFNPMFFKFDKAKLCQHEVYDDFNNLIAPWELGNEVRTNSIVGVVATFCPFDVRVRRNTLDRGFKRHFELRGLYMRVLKRGNGVPMEQVPPLVPPGYVPRGYKKQDKSINDFPGFVKK